MKRIIASLLLIFLFLSQSIPVSAITEEQERKFWRAIKLKTKELERTGAKRALELLDIDVTYGITIYGAEERDLIKLRKILFGQLMPTPMQIKLGNNKLQSYLDNTYFHELYWDNEEHHYVVEIKNIKWFFFNYCKFQIPYEPVRDNYIQKLEHIIQYFREHREAKNCFYTKSPEFGEIGILINSGKFVQRGKQPIKWPITLYCDGISYQIGYYTMDSYWRIRILHVDPDEMVEPEINAIYTQFLKLTSGE